MLGAGTGGWHIHTCAYTFFHPRLNVALLAPGKLLAEAQMEIAEEREHLPGTHSPVRLGLECHAYFLRLVLLENWPWLRLQLLTAKPTNCAGSR